MVEKILNFLRNRRRSWRTISLSELGEMYTAMTIRSLAVSIIGVFVPVFLYQNGYSVTEILLFFSAFFFTRAVFDVVAGFIVARWGPKHTMMLSNLFLIGALALFVLLPEYDFPYLLPGVVLGVANSIFFIAFHVDFSKIKHRKTEGSELGTMYIFERLGGVIGPILGGVIAYFFGAQMMFVVACALLFVGYIPLLMTVEAVKTKQVLHLRKLNVRPIWRDYVSYGFVGIENNMRILFWPLFLTVVIFTSGGAYIEIGGIVSLGILAAIFSTKVIGALVDKNKGRLLLQVTAVTTAIIHLFRPFVGSAMMAFGVSAAGDVSSVGHRIAFTKGMYDAADSHPGLRIVYLLSMESFASFIKGLLWLELFLVSHYVLTEQIFYIGFIITATASLLIMTQKFKALET